jgi:hypothetical protein
MTDNQDEPHTTNNAIGALVTYEIVLQVHRHAGPPIPSGGRRHTQPQPHAGMRVQVVCARAQRRHRQPPSRSRCALVAHTHVTTPRQRNSARHAGNTQAAAASRCCARGLQTAIGARQSMQPRCSHAAGWQPPVLHHWIQRKATKARYGAAVMQARLAPIASARAPRMCEGSRQRGSQGASLQGGTLCRQATLPCGRSPHQWLSACCGVVPATAGAHPEPMPATPTPHTRSAAWAMQGHSGAAHALGMAPPTQNTRTSCLALRAARCSW